MENIGLFLDTFHMNIEEPSISKKYSCSKGTDVSIFTWLTRIGGIPVPGTLIFGELSIH